MNTQEKITDLEKYLTENNVAFARPLEERHIASYFFYGEELSLAQMLNTVNLAEFPPEEVKLSIEERSGGETYLRVSHYTVVSAEEYFETLCNYVESLHGVAYRNKEEYELYVKLKLKYEGNQG